MYKLIHWKLYFSRFRECWIMSHRLSGVSFIRFLYLKIRYNYIEISDANILMKNLYLFDICGTIYRSNTTFDFWSFT